MIKIKNLAVLFLSTSFITISSAQAEWYLGVDKIPSSDWYQLEDYSIDTSPSSFSEPGLRLYSGYKASDLFSIELEYKDQMQFGVGNLFHGHELWMTDEDTVDVDTKALFLSGQSTFNIDERKQLFVRGGLYNWDIDPNNKLNGDTYINRQGTDIFYSIGSYFDISDTFGFSAEWERFEFDNEDVDFISTEFHFNF